MNLFTILDQIERNGRMPDRTYTDNELEFGRLFVETFARNGIAITYVEMTNVEPGNEA